MGYTTYNVIAPLDDCWYWIHSELSLRVLYTFAKAFDTVAEALDVLNITNELCLRKSRQRYESIKNSPCSRESWREL